MEQGKSEDLAERAVRWLKVVRGVRVPFCSAFFDFGRSSLLFLVAFPPFFAPIHAHCM